MMLILRLAFATVLLATVHGQYSPEEQKMSISMFQFDPSQLGIYNKPARHKPRLRLKKNHLPKLPIIAKNGKVVKKEAINAENGTDSQNSTLDAKSQLLNSNPTPSRQDAMKHLKDVKFDGSSDTKNSSSLLLANNTRVADGVGNSTANATKQLPKEELLFYRNKTNSAQDGSEKVNSIKLTKTTSPETHQDSVPIVQTFNATKAKNSSSALLNSNSTRNASNDDNVHSKNTSANLDSPKNASITNSESPKKTNSSSSLIDNEKKNTSTNSNKTVKREEILSHFIPTILSSDADRRDSFQSGSRKHAKHQMYPECYTCPKSSNYTECIKKATLQKCNEGLNNICFAKSHKIDVKENARRNISYEMGCTNHKNCGDAKAFPCRDGSEHCFTCCQFDKCNASPHHGDFEKDEINLDELTKEKEVKKSAASKDNCINVVVVITSFYLALYVFK